MFLEHLHSPAGNGAIKYFGKMIYDNKSYRQNNKRIGQGVKVVNVVLKIVKYTLVVITAMLLIAVFYATGIISTVDLTPFERIVKNSEIYSTKIKFEEGALVNREEFDLFLKFTRSESYPSDFLNKLVSTGALRVRAKDYEIQKDFETEGLYRNDCKELYCFQNYQLFQNIPSDMWKGLIGIEDFRFLSHSGVDFRSILRAIIIDIKEMRMVQGGSTLTQQLVKNLYLTNEKKLSRKLKELIISLYLESKYEKDKILELYFNEVFWGSINGVRVKGVYAASVLYFGKRPAELTPYESAILVSMLKGPNYFHPIKHMERLKKRANVVYEVLKEKSMTPITINYKWNDVTWSNWSKNLEKESNKILYRSLWWTTTEESRFDEYERYVLKIKALEKLSSANYENLAFKAMIKDLQTSNIYSFYSKYERDKEKAIKEEKHQIGSTIKPIVYGIYRKLGLDWNVEVSTAPITVKLKSGDWEPKDSEKITEEFVTASEALVRSINRPLIRLAVKYGFDEIEKELSPKLPDMKKPLAEYPAQLLGAYEISMGSYMDLYENFIIDNCKDFENDSVLLVLSDPTKTTVRKAVGKNLREMRFFGKTGTTNSGYDNWYVAFDGRYLSLFWFGYEGARDGQMLKLYGSTTSFKVFNDFSRDKGKRFNELSCEIINNQ